MREVKYEPNPYLCLVCQKRFNRNLGSTLDIVAQGEHGDMVPKKTARPGFTLLDTKTRQRKSAAKKKRTRYSKQFRIEKAKEYKNCVEKAKYCAEKNLDRRRLTEWIKLIPRE